MGGSGCDSGGIKLYFFCTSMPKLQRSGALQLSELASIQATRPTQNISAIKTVNSVTMEARWQHMSCSRQSSEAQICR